MNQNIKHSVFIVDDDQDDRESIRDAFMENKHHQDYTFMVNGDQLIGHLNEASDKKHPSLILLDLNYAGQRGHRSVEADKRQRPAKIDSYCGDHNVLIGQRPGDILQAWR